MYGLSKSRLCSCMDIGLPCLQYCWRASFWCCVGGLCGNKMVRTWRAIYMCRMEIKEEENWKEREIKNKK